MDRGLIHINQHSLSSLAPNVCSTFWQISSRHVRIHSCRLVCWDLSMLHDAIRWLIDIDLWEGWSEWHVYFFGMCVSPITDCNLQWWVNRWSYSSLYLLSSFFYGKWPYVNDDKMKVWDEIELRLCCSCKGTKCSLIHHSKCIQCEVKTNQSSAYLNAS